MYASEGLQCMIVYGCPAAYGGNCQRDVMALGNVVKCVSMRVSSEAHRPLIFRDANVINNSAFKRNEISRAVFTHTFVFLFYTHIH